MGDDHVLRAEAGTTGLRLPPRIAEHGYWIGVFAAVYAWVAILVSILLNPEWNGLSSPLSDLGETYARDPWVYNEVALLPSGLLLAAFALYLLARSRNRWQAAGSACFLLGGLLLSLVGIFHQGPYPPGNPGQNLHDLFAAWFFVQAFLSVLTWGVGLLREGRKELGVTMLLLAVGSVTVALAILAWLHTIPGATGEVLGVCAIDVWVLLMFYGRDPA